MPGAIYDMPFENDFDTTVLRHERSRKWFGIIMSVKKETVGQMGDGEVGICGMECPAYVTVRLSVVKGKQEKWPVTSLWIKACCLSGF